MNFYGPAHHHRRSIRLKGYDYTQPGAYFVTMCTHNRAYLFGAVVDGEMRLNALGEVARQCWLAIPDHLPHATLDEFVIMPNHVHGIIWIVGANVGTDVGRSRTSGRIIIRPYRRMTVHPPPSGRM
ncbi:MAG: hypothetical protein Kow0063_11050 [Anaerolineae bacterium]